MTCPKCGAEIRNGARYCGACGLVIPAPGAPPVAEPPRPARSGSSVSPAPMPLPPAPGPATQEPAPLPLVRAALPATGPGAGPAPAVEERERRGCAPLAPLRRLLGRRGKRRASSGPAAQWPAGQAAATQALSEQQPIAVFRDQFVTVRHELRSKFGLYEVYDLTCPTCHIAHRPGTGPLCPRCGQRLPLLLLHVSSQPGEPEIDIRDLERLTGRNPLVLKHLAYWREQGRGVLMLPYPPGWAPLFRLVPIADARQVADWGLCIGNALAYLHGQQVAHHAMDQESVESIVVYDGKPRLSDLTKAHSLLLLTPDKATECIQRDIQFLVKVVEYMASGQARPMAGDSPFRAVFTRAHNNGYTAIGSLLDDLKSIRDGLEVPTGASFVAAAATHEGKVRPANEDSFYVQPPIQQARGHAPLGLYVVADGMGGQESGEQASLIAYTTIASEIHNKLVAPALGGSATRRLDGSPGDVLKEAVAAANQRVFDTARQRGNNMGTTVTAALLQGSYAYVVNVGDSRTYRLRNGVLDKVTTDHSLVASLVAAGAISPEEVYTHPHRNQIYRSLGDNPGLEVDLFSLDLRRGDQLLLCSDGLWEMVRDPQIRDILMRAATPGAAAQALVRAAYDAGGEDNITVIVIRVE